MSQHQIHILSSTMGFVRVTTGIDPPLNEAFINCYNDQHSHTSPPGLGVDDIAAYALEHMGVRLPTQMLAELEAERAEWRLGAPDIGRRIRRYRSDGTLFERFTL